MIDFVTAKGPAPGTVLVSTGPGTLCSFREPSPSSRYVLGTRVLFVKGWYDPSGFACRCMFPYPIFRRLERFSHKEISIVYVILVDGALVFDFWFNNNGVTPCWLIDGRLFVSA